MQWYQGFLRLPNPLTTVCVVQIPLEQAELDKFQSLNKMYESASTSDSRILVPCLILRIHFGVLSSCQYVLGLWC